MAGGVPISSVPQICTIQYLAADNSASAQSRGTAFHWDGGRQVACAMWRVPSVSRTAATTVALMSTARVACMVAPVKAPFETPIEAHASIPTKGAMVSASPRASTNAENCGHRIQNMQPEAGPAAHPVNDAQRDGVGIGVGVYVGVETHSTSQCSVDVPAMQRLLRP